MSDGGRIAGGGKPRLLLPKMPSGCGACHRPLSIHPQTSVVSRQTPAIRPSADVCCFATNTRCPSPNGIGAIPPVALHQGLTQNPASTPVGTFS
jgi:hypothetical protein